MGWIKDFGSRNHPRTLARKERRRKAIAAMRISDEEVATYGAARAFLLGEWFGASLMDASVVLLYLLAAPGRGATSGGTALGVSLATLALGTAAFWSSRRYYGRLDFPWAPRWHTAALVVAGAAGIFWLLFALLEALALGGVRILPG